MTKLLVCGRPVGLFGVSLENFGHLFFALSDDDVLSDNDLVIRAGPSGSFLNSPLNGQISVTLGESNDSFASVAEQLSLDESEIFDVYVTASLNLGSDGFNTNVFEVWDTLADLGSQVIANGFTYNLAVQNSNSFVGTLLSILGIDNTSLTAIQTPNDWIPFYAYLAVTHSFAQDFYSGTSYGYTIRGSSLFLDSIEMPLADRLFALNANTPFAPWATGDFVTTFGGNDELHDGNRKDTLEGGAGDDIFILQDDGAADIIITGEGDDIVRGGGAEDRLVLRIDILDKMYEDWKAQLEYSNENHGANFVLTGDALVKPSERMGEDAATSGLPILGGFWDMACDGVECVRLNTGTFYPTLSNPEETGPGSLAATFPQLVYAYSWNDGDGVAQQAQVFPFGYSFELVDGDLVITFAYGTPPEGQKGIDIAQHTVTVKDFQDGDFGIHIYDPTLIIVPGSPVYEFDMHLEEWVVANSGPDSAYASVTDAEHVSYINNGGHYIPILAAIDPATTGIIPQSPPQAAPRIDGDGNDNLIYGDASGELIRGHAGNDTINAIGGDDRVDGGDGDDVIHLGNGADLAIGGSGLDVLFGEVGSDGISGGAGDDQISGGAGKDWLFGDTGNDVIAGDGGDDTLEGGDGDDSLDGGAGLDTL